MGGTFLPIGVDDVDGFLQAQNFTKDGSRTPNLWVVHDEEYPERSDAAWDVARYFAGANAPRSSAHVCVDDRNAIGCVDWRDIAWHSGHGATNNRSIGIEHSGYASQSREEWLDEYGMKMLDRSARLFAEIGHGQFSIPPVKLSPEQVAAGEAGICGHVDVTRGYNIYGGHTDPGDQFPWDIYLDLIKKHLTGSSEEDEVKTYILIDPRDHKAWLCAGNTKYHLATMDELNVHKFFGAPEVNPAPVEWIDSLCTIKDAV